MRILEWPRDAALLRRVARPVLESEFASQELVDFGSRLGDLMMRSGGLGLAATQVAESSQRHQDTGTSARGGEPWAMFAIRLDENAFSIVCNPEIQHTANWTMGSEACLSFASVVETLKAPDIVVFTGRTPRGKVDGTAYNGIHARCVFHECEHLKGRTMIDRMGVLQRRLFMQRVTKARASNGHVSSPARSTG